MTVSKDKILVLNRSKTNAYCTVSKKEWYWIDHIKVNKLCKSNIACYSLTSIDSKFFIYCPLTQTSNRSKQVIERFLLENKYKIFIN